MNASKITLTDVERRCVLSRVPLAPRLDDDEIIAAVETILTDRVTVARRQALLDAANDPAMTGSWQPFAQWLKQRAGRIEVQP